MTRARGKGDGEMRLIRLIGATTVFLVLGLTAPCYAGQEKPEENSKAPMQEQQAKPEKQEQAKAPKQEQQAKPEKQQEAKAPKQEQQAKPEKQEQAKAPKQEQQAKPEKQQEAKAPKQEQQAKPEKQQQAKAPKQEQQAKGQPQQQGQQHSASSKGPQRTQEETATQHAQPQLRLSARGSGRIPDAQFHSHFGRGHEFRMGNPVMVSGYSRFQYGGYWFGYVQPWPVGWYYTDQFYIDYVDGGYYMYDPYYPGARFAITVVI